MSAISAPGSVKAAIAAATVNALLDQVERICDRLCTRSQGLPDPAELRTAMDGAGLFAMAVPEGYGGLGLSLADVWPVWAAVARLDPAVAGELMRTNVATDLTARLPATGAAEVFAAGPLALVPALDPVGRAVHGQGGWRITAAGLLAGSRTHADWYAVCAHPGNGDEPAGETTAPLIAFVPGGEVRLVQGRVVVTDVLVPFRRVTTTPERSR